MHPDIRRDLPFLRKLILMMAFPPRLSTSADALESLGLVALERQRREIVVRIFGGRTELWELSRLFRNRQKLPKFAGMPYAEISTGESFVVAWLICRVAILSNLVRAKFRLYA
jgi:hypothetical protein